MSVIGSREKRLVTEEQLTAVNWGLSAWICDGRQDLLPHGSENETLNVSRRTETVKGGGYQSSGCGRSTDDDGDDGGDGAVLRPDLLVAGLRAQLAKQRSQGDLCRVDCA